MPRILAVLLALFLLGEGGWMLLRPEAWYSAVPGVTETGPFNRHFVSDIGAAFLVAGLGAAWSAWRPAQAWPALVAGVAFLTVHALIHLGEGLAGHGLGALARDFGGVLLPTLVGLLLVSLLKPRTEGG